MMLMYSKFNGYDYKGTNVSMHPKFTLGNIGSNEAYCKNNIVNLPGMKQEISCPTGTI